MSSSSETTRFLQFLVLFALGLVTFLALFSHASPGSKRFWSLQAEVDLSYDDNIINYSDFDLDLFESGGREQKFAIESKSDFITAPKFTLQLNPRILKRYASELSFTYRYKIYSKNSVKNYHFLSATVHQSLRKCGYWEFRYYFIPEYYYRNQYDQTSGEYKEAYFEKHSLTFEYGYYFKKYLKGAIGYSYRMKDFDLFDERDAQYNSIYLESIWRYWKTVKFWGEYRVNYSRAEGRDNPDPAVKDVSYDSWGVTLGSRIYGRHFLPYPAEFVTAFKFDRILFQTEKVLDEYRLGRRDNNCEIRFGLAASPLKKVRLELDYYYSTKGVTLTEESLARRLEYTSNEIRLGLRYEY